MRREVYIVVLSVLAVVSANISQAQEKRKLTADIVLGPYVQAVTSDSFTVVWKTDMDAVAWVETAPDDGTHFFAQERPAYYQTVAGKRPVGRLHRVTVSGLEPGTVYRYRVMQQAVLTPPDEKRIVFGIASGNNPFRQQPYEVRTLDPDAETLDFAIINDIHGKDQVFRQLMADIPSDSIDMVFFNGDMLSSMDSEKQLFDGYLKSAAELFAANIPFYNSRGNHEGRGMFSYRYLDYFPTSTGETYYMVRQGPAAILVLDCGEDKPDSDVSYFGLADYDSFREKEAEWLRNTVCSEEFRSAPVKIAVLHIPASTGGWHGNAEINRLFIPVLEEAGIDLMISGHIHRYSYSEPGERGCSFPVLINGADEKHYFHIAGDSIKAERIDQEGTVLNTFEINVGN